MQLSIELAAEINKKIEEMLPNHVEGDVVVWMDDIEFRDILNRLGYTVTTDGAILNWNTSKEYPEVEGGGA